VPAVWEKLRKALRRTGEVRDGNIVENARVIRERDKHRGQEELPPEQRNKFWAWFPPG